MLTSSTWPVRVMGAEWVAAEIWPSGGRRSSVRPGAEVGPHRDPAGTDPALGDGDGAERQQRGGRAEESHEQIGDSPAHTSHGPRSGTARVVVRPFHSSVRVASLDRG